MCSGKGLSEISARLRLSVVKLWVKFQERGGRKMKRILIFSGTTEGRGTGRISEKQAGGCHRQCCHSVWKRLYGCRRVLLM